MSDVVIRKPIFEDAKAVNDAHKRSLRELCSKDYNEEQIKNWSNVTYDLDLWKKNIADNPFFVVEKAGKIEGFIHGRVHPDNTREIMGLYFTPEITGQGYGRKAFEMIMDEIKKSNPSKVVITGTITAKPFYEAMGFVEVEQKEIEIRGSMVQVHQMELIL